MRQPKRHGRQRGWRRDPGWARSRTVRGSKIVRPLRRNVSSSVIGKAIRFSRDTAEVTGNAIIQQPKPIRGAVKTITFDNRPEFAEHGRVAGEVTAPTYFCDPLQFLAARDQREYQRADTSVFPEGNRFSKGDGYRSSRGGKKAE